MTEQLPQPAKRVSDGRQLGADEPLYIEHLSAYVVMDPADHTEGVIAMVVGGVAYPMVMADEEMLVRLRPQAVALARTFDVPVSLVRFSTRTVLVADILKEAS
jgi:hypothetical protein